MDIISNSENKLSATLSNFAEHYFELDGVKIKSMESFLQSLKVKNIKDQEIICSWPGYKAKRFFKQITDHDGKLYWQGKEYNRMMKEYQELLDRAYNALFKQNEEFRNALLSTNDEKLTHNIGKSSRINTILTNGEFINRLTKLRKYGSLIQEEKNKELF